MDPEHVEIESEWRCQTVEQGMNEGVEMKGDATTANDTGLEHVFLLNANLLTLRMSQSKFN